MNATKLIEVSMNKTDNRNIPDPALTHISLFTGAGGLDIGLGQAKFDTRVCVENDGYCQQTLELNRHKFRNSSFKVLGDITEVSPGEILETSGLSPGETVLLSGGPPCQSFSTAGRRGSISDSRGNLFFYFADVIKVAQPRFFMMENVRGLLSAAIRHRPLHLRGNGNLPLDNEEELGSVFNQVIIPTFEDDLGYEISFGLLNSLDYGVAQARVRLIILGSRDHEFGSSHKRPDRTPIESLLPPTHNQHGTDGKQRWQTLGEGLQDLRDPNPEYLRYSEARAEVLRLVPAGKNWRYIRDNYSDEYLRKVMGGAYNSSGGRVGFWRRLSFDKWSPTLPASPIQKGTSLCHPEEIRPLSINEYARIQSFPDDWEFSGSTHIKYRQMGNAVPAKLGMAIGNGIYNLLA